MDVSLLVGMESRGKACEVGRSSFSRRIQKLWSEPAHQQNSGSKWGFGVNKWPKQNALSFSQILYILGSFLHHPPSACSPYTLASMDLMPTPPRPLPSCYVEEAPETPGPIRARVNNLQNQVSELVRKEHAATVRPASFYRTELMIVHNSANIAPRHPGWITPSPPRKPISPITRPRSRMPKRSWSGVRTRGKLGRRN